MFKIIDRQHFLLVLATAWSLHLNAQEYSFQHFGVEDGLSQSVATTLSQHHNGGLWIGTMSGLTYYDGHQMKVFGEKNGLAEDWITASFVDQQGNSWFGHWGGGVTVCSADTMDFRQLDFERFSNFKTVTSIIQDLKGNIWFGTAGAGLFIYELENQSVVSLSQADGFPNNEVNSMVSDEKQNIWIATNEGLVIYDMGKAVDEKGAFSIIGQEDGLSDKTVNHLAMMKNGSVLASTPFNGINRIQLIDGMAKIDWLTIDEGLPSNKINCVLEDEDQNIWIGTRDAGVIKYDVSANHFQQFSTRQGLNYFNVQSLMQDRERNIWIGTDLGLNLFKGEAFMIYNERDGIINNIVWSVAGDQEGNIWLGTNRGLSKLYGLSERTKDNVEEQLQTSNYGLAQGLSSEIVLSVYPDNDGKIWCGTGFGGISVLSESGFKTIGKNDGLASNTVFTIEKDAQGDFWFGTSEGASRYTPASGSIQNFDEKDGMGGKHVYKIFKDSKNRLWFSVLGGYLSYYENKKFVILDSSMGLNEKFITCITEDKKGNIWFGAYGSGVYVYDGEHFRNYSTAEGLSSNFPYSLVADLNNNLWIGTSRGVDQLNTSENIVKNYGKREGFMGIEPNPNAIYKDKSGNIWFGTIMGAARFDLSKSRINQVSPYIELVGLKINHVPNPFPENGEFDYEKNNLTIDFQGISMTNPQHLKYSYMLEGFDQDWSPVTAVPRATYSNLPPGKYTFKARVANSDGIWGEEILSRSITIIPPFYMTWYFYVICAILLLILVYYGDKLRSRNLMLANARLEQKVEERTVELAVKNKELASKNRDIMDSIRYAERIQKAILPAEGKLKNHLPESFVFFQPKDIVSGDFYWMEVQGDKILFAAADCTGHGVPGAFMSIIGYNGLNKVVKEEKILEPAKILNRLSQIVEETLQYSDDFEISDGLDIAICSLDKKKMELEYAGAYNPLYLVRNGELMVTKGDRSAVGGSPINKETTKKFANHRIKLQSKDALYIFSDGVPDQFGGPNGRKFRYNQFRELIISANGKSMNDQKMAIDKAIKEWMGEMDQIDDMVVMGVKVV